MANIAQLFEFAVILQAKRNSKGDQSEPAKLVVDPTTILAHDVNQAQLLAGRAIPEEYLSELDRLTIVVRPF